MLTERRTEWVTWAYLVLSDRTRAHCLGEVKVRDERLSNTISAEHRTLGDLTKKELNDGGELGGLKNCEQSNGDEEENERNIARKNGTHSLQCVGPCEEQVGDW